MPKPAVAQKHASDADPYAGPYQAAAVFIAVLAAYFMLQLIIRLSQPGSLEIDEAEQVFVFQTPRLGYGSQPPLYSWLQWLMFSAFGVNLFALSLLKNLLLFGTYVCMLLMARPMIGAGGAITAAASLILFPSIGWESHIDRTHSVLLTFLACATLWCYFSLLRRPAVARYALFGLLVGFGLQSKYNFAIFVAGLSAASVLTPEHQRIVWNRKAWVAAAVALLTVLPHASWLVNHLDAASGATLQKMIEGQQHAGYLRNLARGVLNMLVAALAFITPLWIVYGISCRGSWRRAVIDRRDPDARFFVRLYLAFFACVVLLLLSGKVSNVQSRWMQPLLFSLPLAFFVVVPASRQPQVYKRILHASAAVAIVMLLALALRAHLAPLVGKPLRSQYPYPQLSAEIAQRFPHVRALIAEDTLTAGNLYFWRPMTRTLTLDQIGEGIEQVEGDVLLLAREGAPADWLGRFWAAYPHSVMRQQGRFQLRYGPRDRQSMTFDYALVSVSPVMNESTGAERKSPPTAGK